ncbi:hypothetical protein MMC07_004613 [Pseudocyphellaria aurata]|nr:hypothetical protein [Pseudocyphellaria aurata]
MPPTTHHVIALISGGKDSFLALLHCLAQNHHVVALANLHPPPQSSSSSLSASADPTTDAATDTAPDANSHMYQTVGHTLIPLYARALSVPLYRGDILGAAINSQRDYHPSPSYSSPPTSDPTLPQPSLAEPADETESLIPLLQRIQRAHPSATALVSGAILSNYQRTRIESVALRLGLVPFAPLWQYPYLPTPVPRPAGLLEDVAAVGLGARIIKVASGGLDEGLLWADLRDPAVRRRVEGGVGRFGGSVLGEGGEFETLVVDGPGGVFKGRLELDGAERIVRRGEGGEAYLAFTGGRVVEKEDKTPVEGDNRRGEEWRPNLRVPTLWDERFKALVDKIKEPILLPPRASCSADVDDPHSEYHAVPTDPPPSPSPALNKRVIILQPHATLTRSTLTISNLTSFYSSFSSSSSPPLSLVSLPSPPSSSTDAAAIAIRQTHAITTHLRALLAASQPPRSPSDILFTTLLLRHMSHFSHVNTAYAEFFADEAGGGQPIPPARVTIGCGDQMPPGVEVVMRAVVGRGVVREKDGLHVQSRSYWAPANIGPYSQAVAMPLLPHLRGLEEQEADDQEGPGKPAVVYVAGQIPLIPSSMEVFIPEGTGVGTQQTCLALQHLWRVGTAMRVQWWMGAIAFLAHAPPGKQDGARIDEDREMEMKMERRARIAWSAWEILHDPTFFSSNPEGEDQEDGFDVWDQKYGMARSWRVGKEEEHEHRLPDFRRVIGTGDEGSRRSEVESWETGMSPGFFAVQVDELPRGCSVEWQALGVRNVQDIHVQSSSSPRVQGKQAGSARTCTAARLGTISYISIPLLHNGTSLANELRALVRDIRQQTLAMFGEAGTLDLTIYHTSMRFGEPEVDADAEGKTEGDLEGGHETDSEREYRVIATALAKAQLVPCRAVWGPGGSKLAAGIVAQVDF